MSRIGRTYFGLNNASIVRLAVVSAPLGSGGAERHTVRILNELSPERYRVTVLCPPKKGNFEEDLRPGIQVLHLGSESLARRSSTAGRLSMLAGLRRYFGSQETDVVLSVQDGLNVLTLHAMGSLPRGTPVVLCVQNSIDDEYSNRWSPAEAWIRWAIRKRYQEASRVVALSQGVATALERWNPRLSGKLDVIYNAGLDDSVLESVSASTSIRRATPAVPRFLAAGRLCLQKGYPVLLEALARLRDEGMVFEQHILGSGPMEADLSSQVASLRLGDRVKFLGFDKNPFRHMAEATVFVLPSLYEGFGNVIVEAMASGAPVVASNCPHGPSEIIRDGQNGLLVPPGDPVALAAALQRLLEDPGLRNRFAAAGRERARDFHARTIAARYNALLGGLLARA